MSVAEVEPVPLGAQNTGVSGAGRSETRDIRSNAENQEQGPKGATRPETHPVSGVIT